MSDKSSPHRLRRITREHQQERKSRIQLEEFLTDSGWLCESFLEDVGEDHLVRIYADGRSSGLTFFIQIKSTTDIDGWPSPTPDVVSYSIDVKDLLHWEDSNPPVVLVLWDVVKRVGVWVLVSDAIKALRSHETWRTQGEVAVRFPIRQRLDTAGLPALRRRIAMEALPLISQGKEFAITTRFVFPDTDVGRAKLLELEQHIATGAPVSLSGEFVDSVQFPDWWTRMAGEFPVPATIAMGAASSGRMIPFSMAVRSRAGNVAEIPYLECIAVLEGKEQVTLSNAAQKAPVHVTLVLDREPRQYRATIAPHPGPGLGVTDQMRLARLLRCLSEGCELTLTILKSEGGRFVTDLAPKPELAPPLPWCSLLEDLSAIERNCKVSFQLDDSFSKRDAARANRIAGIVTKGYELLDSSRGSFSVKQESLKAWLLEAESPFPFDIQNPSTASEPIDLFGASIDLGPVRTRALGFYDREDLDRRLAALGPDEDLVISLAGADVRREFERFLPQESAREGAKA